MQPLDYNQLPDQHKVLIRSVNRLVDFTTAAVAEGVVPLKTADELSKVVLHFTNLLALEIQKKRDEESKIIE